MRRVPHVAVLIETSRAYGRGLLEGVARYNREHGFWSMFFEPHGLDDPPPKWLSAWEGDGVLVRINDQRMARAIRAADVPAVDLRGRVPHLGLPFIGVDNFAVARLAFEHLRDRGFRDFGFCGVARGHYFPMDKRREFFRQLAERAGFPGGPGGRPGGGGGGAPGGIGIAPPGTTTVPGIPTPPPTPAPEKP